MRLCKYQGVIFCIKKHNTPFFYQKITLKSSNKLFAPFLTTEIVKTNIVVKIRSNNLTFIMKHGERDRTNDRFRIPQYCSLTILCQLSDQATFISIKSDGYNTEIENISQKDSTFGRRDLVGVTSRSISVHLKRITICNWQSQYSCYPLSCFCLDVECFNFN